VAGLRVDAHVHYVSPRVFAALRRDAARYGVTYLETPAPQVHLPDAPPARPILPALSDLDGLRAHRHRQGFDRLVLGPLMDLAGYGLPVEQGARLSRLVNESLAADLAAKEACWGLATVPLQDGDAAAAELRYAVRHLGLRGAMIDTNVRGRSLAQAPLEPFWAEAQALGVPVVLHPFAVPALERLRPYYLHNVVGYPLETTLAAAELVFGGVLRRFPGLRVVLVHGGGFLPYQIGRLERAYRAREEARVHLDVSPAQFLQAFYYDALTHHPAALRFLVEQVGAARVLLGSDYPFSMADPAPGATLDAAGLAPEARQMVAGGTALALFAPHTGGPASPRPAGPHHGEEE
jgi:aminocarboxymuconate-semialdehyde decarboxylase